MGGPHLAGPGARQYSTADRFRPPPYRLIASRLARSRVYTRRFGFDRNPVWAVSRTPYLKPRCRFDLEGSQRKIEYGTPAESRESPAGSGRNGTGASAACVRNAFDQNLRRATDG